MEQPKIDLSQHAREHVISGRSLDAYANALGFTPADLEGHQVLNFGCGGSNLGVELAKAGINCTVTDTDILPNPHTVHDERLSDEERWRRSVILRSKIADHEDGQPSLPAVEAHENTLLGIEDRTFVQLIPHALLPFPDDHFDDALVLWVYHQLPWENRTKYLTELLRVARTVRIAPAGQRELTEITDFLENHPEVRLTTSPCTARADSSPPRTIPELDIDYTTYPRAVAATGAVRVVLERSV
jgi:SAM-dependent methyltransferase